MCVKKNKKIFIFIILIGFIFGNKIQIPFFRIFGIVPTLFRLTTLISVYVLTISIIKNKQKIFERKKEEKYVLIFSFGWFIYSFFRIDLNHLKDFIDFAFCIINFISLYILTNENDEKKFVIKCISILLIIITIFSIIEIITGIHFGYSRFNGHNVPFVAVAQFFNENDLSAFLGILLPVFNLSDIRKEIKIMISIIILFIIILNKSLFVLGSLIVCCIIYIFVYIFQKINNKKFLIISTSLLFIFSKNSIINYLMSSSSLIYRQHMYKYGLRNCIEHFWIGNGIGNYEEGMYSVGYYTLQYSSANPHCLLLEIWGEFGFFVFIFFLLYLCYKIFNSFYQFFKKNIISNWLILCIPIIYIFSIFSSSSCIEKSYTWLGLIILSWLNNKKIFNLN